MERTALKFHRMCLKRPLICQYSFLAELGDLIYFIFLSPPPLFSSVSPSLPACYCCQWGLCFPRQSVLCQCGLACVIQEGRNLVLCSARDLPQTCVCVCVVEILRPCVLTFEVGFGSPCFIIAIKMSIRKQNLEMNRVLEIPSGHKHADRTRKSWFFKTETRNQMSAE